MNRRSFLAGSVLLPAAYLLPSVAQAQRSRSEIVIGQSLDLSGPLQNTGRDYFTGAKIAFDDANANGGIGGRKIRLLQLDDGAQPQRAVDNVKKLVQDERVDLLFGMTSDACVDAILKSPAFTASNHLLFAPMSGVDSPAGKERAVYLRASYAEEMATVMERFFRIGWTSLGIAHTATPSSIASRDAAIAMLRERSAAEPRVYAIDENGANAAKVATAISQKPPQAIVVLGDTIPAALFARELMPRNPGMQICLMSSVNVQSLQEMLGTKHAAGIMVSRVTPEAARGLTMVSRDYTRTLNKYLDEAPNAAGMEGFIAARTLLAVLRQSGASPADLDMATLRNVRTVNLGGWTADFRSGNRAAHYVDTAIIAKDGSLLR